MVHGLDLYQHCSHHHHFDGLDYIWSELVLVHNVTTLNILLPRSCLGWFSLVLDVITAGVKYKYCGHGGNNTEDGGSKPKSSLFIPRTIALFSCEEAALEGQMLL